MLLARLEGAVRLVDGERRWEFDERDAAESGPDAEEVNEEEALGRWSSGGIVEKREDQFSSVGLDSDSEPS